MVELRNEELEAAMPEELLTLDEAVKFLDTSKSTLYRLISQEDIKGVKVGKQWRFRKADLTAYMERGPVAVAVDAAARVDLDAELDFFAEEWLAAGQLPETLADGSAGNAPETKVVALAQRILLLAIASQASGIHLEPMGSAVRLRYRIDGVLHDIRRMPMSLHEPLIAHLKERAEMNLMEKRVPQDGRILVRYADKDYDLRMSLIPTLHGENAVLRILDRSSILLGLHRLGMSAAEVEMLRSWLHRPSGMILATGPTGAGKTTFLYSCLKEVNTDEKKVLTIEDPIEYRIPEFTQAQVNKKQGLTFVAGLRSFMRQDPDIIFCGEMRDVETAEMVVEAALTGHLVLTTLHTEDALNALLRLADMGIARYLVTATLNGVVGLRLARRLCPHCKAIADAAETAALIARIKRATEGGGYALPEEATFYTAVGCDQCHRTGFQGRIGLFEMLPCTPRFVAQLFQCNSHEEMTELAVLAGMRTLLADGIRKAVEGVTSIDEVLRATGTWL